MAKKPAASPSTAERYPSLRGALWLYLAVLVSTALIISLAFNIDVGFLNLMAVLLACFGLTIGALFITNVRPSTLFGQRPARRSLIISLLAGLAVWVPASWLQVSIWHYVNVAIGPLRPPLPSTAAPWAILLQVVLIIPLCEGLLFWAYLQRAAEGLGRARGALLAALLYAAYGTILSAGVGVSAFPALLIVGLAAAFATCFTGSAWCGIAVLVGYGAGSPLLESALFDYLGPQYVMEFSFRWLLVVVVTAFITFILIQALRVIGPGGAAIDTRRERPKALWLVPLVISILFLLFIAYGEYVLRVSQRALSGGSTTPGSLVQPVVPPGQPSPQPSQTPQAGNQ
jgi:membrane protease YdiL (CAAX protease family)